MKHSLQLRIGQQLTMTPQLQQAIRLLQLSTLELQQEIQQVLDSNMMLEIPEDEEITPDSPPETQERVDSETADDANLEVSSEGSQDQLPDDLPVDTSWDDIYDSTTGPNLSASSGSDDDTPDPGAINSATGTLQDHLLWQMEMTRFSEADQAIAIAIIDDINEDGYLLTPLEDIHTSLQTEMDDLELDEITAVLHRIQNFDPPGVAARNLQECLSIQLRQLPDQIPLIDEARELVDEFLDLLGNQDTNKLKRYLRLDDESLALVVNLIRSLNPKPGSEIDSREVEYVVPDVYVSKRNGRWQVSLNPDTTPNIRINPYYTQLIKRGDRSADSQTMKDHLQEARWFIKSLQSRNETLLRVTQSIVERQMEFFEHGEVAMKPLVLRDIAEAIEMHESTISRVTTQKYMHTPNGIFELKYFFSSHVSTESGGECSATAIRAFIRELIKNESEKKPLSDSKIASILSERGINVARRTIAKYRESISIPPSSQRKRLL